MRAETWKIDCQRAGGQNSRCSCCGPGWSLWFKGASPSSFPMWSLGEMENFMLMRQRFEGSWGRRSDKAGHLLVPLPYFLDFLPLQSWSGGCRAFWLFSRVFRTADSYRSFMQKNASLCFSSLLSVIWCVQSRQPAEETGDSSQRSVLSE